MTENLLQYIWQYRLYSTAMPLKTLDGEPVIVINPGQLNNHAGPDFLEAKIKIGQTTWAGNVEIHISSSDWQKHKHSNDENYDKLILHVVYKYDTTVKTLHNSTFPTLVLRPYLPAGLMTNYAHIMESKSFIPCVGHLLKVKTITVEMQLQRMLAERLEEKIHHIQSLLHIYQNNWQEVFYVQLARCFGLHINQDAFEKLALQTPLSLLTKYKTNAFQLEALLYGQAGFLFDYFDEEYPLLLQREYVYLKNLHKLSPLSKHHWKFLRLRPANFPTIRIAQFAQLVQRSAHLFSKIVEAKNLKEIEILFDSGVSEYWHTHYTFQEKSASKEKPLGKTFIHTSIINAIVPTLFIYGKLQGKQEICDQAINLLQQVPAEKNSIILQWQCLNIPVKSAADTQALLQLYNKYCNHKKCLACAIGYEILRQS
jgi:hypothetical protein